MLSKEGLLKRRIKVIADWPGVAGLVLPGVIVGADDEFDEDMFWIGGQPFLIDKIRDYPHLFKELKWYEYIEEKDMPRYLQSKSGRIWEVMAYKLANNDVYLKDMNGIPCCITDFQPATKEEYEDYLNCSTQPNASHP